MEFIFDELKQFIIKEVENFEDVPFNYLYVGYKNNIISNENIDCIYLIINITNYSRPNGTLIYKDDICSRSLNQLNQLFVIDKKIDYDELLSIKNYVINNIDLDKDKIDIINAYDSYIMYEYNK